MSERKERPILYSAAEVRATLAGRKTQARRVVKQAVDRTGASAFAVCPAAQSGFIAWFGERRGDIEAFTKKAYQHGFPCPYGNPGDRLWVREGLYSKDTLLWRYAADHQFIDDSSAEAAAWVRKKYKPGVQHCPSIHMPRWASRITLQVVAVRVERLQAISEADAEAEGADTPEVARIIQVGWSKRDCFAKLWESINGPGSWAANPLVWVVEFRRVESEEQR